MLRALTAERSARILTRAHLCLTGLRHLRRPGEEVRTREEGGRKTAEMKADRKDCVQ